MYKENHERFRVCFFVIPSGYVENRWILYVLKEIEGLQDSIIQFYDSEAEANEAVHAVGQLMVEMLNQLDNADLN
jgi:hypothetical protein